MAKKPSSSPISPQLLEALAPAGAHLLAAAVEIVAAAGAAIDALSSGEAGTLPPRALEALAQAKASLKLFASLAETGAAGARSRAKDAAKREALAEILGAIDARAERVEGAARETLMAVRDAVAGAAGASTKRPKTGAQSRKAPESRKGRVKKTSARLRRIPIVLDRSDAEE